MLHRPHRKSKGLTPATTKIQEKENLLKQDFSATQPLKKLLTDISQIPCLDGMLCISPILNYSHGKIILPVMSDNMKKELCVDTFKAVNRRYMPEGTILHFDRSSQYKWCLSASVIKSMCYTESKRCLPLLWQRPDGDHSLQH